VRSSTESFQNRERVFTILRSIAFALLVDGDNRREVGRAGDTLTCMDDEQPRPDANRDEHAYTLTIDDAVRLYEASGHSRTKRAIQKYCLRGDLDSTKEDTEFGQRYRITRASIDRHIEQIKQVSQTYGREQPRPDAPVRMAEDQGETARNDAPSVREQPRPAAGDERYIARLEDDVVFLREQIERKDKQIQARDEHLQAMIERDRETNILIHQMLPQLSARRGGDPFPSQRTDSAGEIAREKNN
jgi:hypothetical protein